MNAKRYHLLDLFVVLIASVAAIVVGTVGREQAQYAGRPLSAWMDDFFLGRNTEQAIKAIRHIGTNALPQLIVMLSSKDSQTKEFLRQAAERHSPAKWGFISASERRERAVIIIELLGNDAKAAIPQLAQILTNDDCAAYAARALVGLGEQGILSLVSALTNQSGWVRKHAAFELGSLRDPDQGHPSASVSSSPTHWMDHKTARGIVLPSLIGSLRDKDASVRSAAAGSLGQIGMEPSLVVPALNNALNDPDLEVRLRAAGSLSQFAENATPAIPALLEAIAKEIGPARATMIYSLKKIDPNAAVSEGVKPDH